MARLRVARVWLTRNGSDPQRWLTRLGEGIRLELTRLGHVARKKKTFTACILHCQARWCPTVLCEWRQRRVMVSTEERVLTDDVEEERTEEDRGRSTVRCNTRRHGWRETNGCASWPWRFDYATVTGTLSPECCIRWWLEERGDSYSRVKWWRRKSGVEKMSTKYERDLFNIYNNNKYYYYYCHYLYYHYLISPTNSFFLFQLIFLFLHY